MGSQSQGASLVRYEPEQVAGIAQELRSLYGAVYAEPPYCETESDAAEFESRLSSQVNEPAFSLFAAWDDDRLAGYIYGFAIESGSPLWTTVFLSPEPRYNLRDWTCPVAFVSELLVASNCRHRGIATVLHSAFVAARNEPKAVLLAHPEATAAQAAYRAWDWYRIGSGRPWPNTPLYDTLVKDLASAKT